MTLFLVDLASYQEGIDLAAVRRAGFGLANIKTSQGNWYTWSAARTYADRARVQGFGLSTFHWLDNTASGAEQARIAYGHMVELGGPDGMAHQCDNEDTTRPASWAITRDYVHAMQDLLGRPIVMYTGDWWATAPARAGWDVASLTPYLMAAPNRDYLPGYPGDDSADWLAGYWGYDYLSLMQYAVAPIDGAGGGKISKTAIRSPEVWAALTGGDDMPLSEDDIARIWAYKIGGPNNHREVHFRLSDAADMITDGKSSYDGQAYGVPVALENLHAAVDNLSVAGVDPDALAAKVAERLDYGKLAQALAAELAHRLDS